MSISEITKHRLQDRYDFETFLWDGYAYTTSEKFVGEALAKGVYLSGGRKVIRIDNHDEVIRPGTWLLKLSDGRVIALSPGVFNLFFEPVGGPGE